MGRWIMSQPELFTQIAPVIIINDIIIIIIVVIVVAVIVVAVAVSRTSKAAEAGEVKWTGGDYEAENGVVVEVVEEVEKTVEE